MDLYLRQHLEDWAYNCNMIPSTHIDYLKKLKSNGVEPKVIYDIGANVLQWTRNVEKIWNNAEIIVFDGFDAVEFLYKEGNYKYHIGVLGESDGKEVKWFQNDYMHTGNSYYKEKNNNIFPEDKFLIKKLKTLSTVVKENNFPYPDLIKIDVQGCEKDIIKGGEEIIKNAKDLIVEMQHTEYNIGAPYASEVIPYIESLGFKLIEPLFCNNGPDGDYHFTRI